MNCRMPHSAGFTERGGIMLLIVELAMLIFSNLCVSAAPMTNLHSMDGAKTPEEQRQSSVHEQQLGYPATMQLLLKQRLEQLQQANTTSAELDRRDFTFISSDETQQLQQQPQQQELIHDHHDDGNGGFQPLIDVTNRDGAQSISGESADSAGSSSYTSLEAAASPVSYYNSQASLQGFDDYSQSSYTTFVDDSSATEAAKGPISRVIGFLSSHPAAKALLPALFVTSLLFLVPTVVDIDKRSIRRRRSSEEKLPLDHDAFVQLLADSLAGLITQPKPFIRRTDEKSFSRLFQALITCDIASRTAAAADYMPCAQYVIADWLQLAPNDSSRGNVKNDEK